MDFGGLLLLGFLWLLFNLLGRSRQGRPPARPLPPAAPPPQGDATQREGSRLEALLREFERALDQSAGRGPLGRPGPDRLPGAEEVEERATLETAARVVSLEDEVARPERPVTSHDEDAERLVARRIAAAEARGGALTRADHALFDERIRQTPADATAVRTLTPSELRRAVIWREILGPPAALQPPDR